MKEKKVEEQEKEMEQPGSVEYIIINMAGDVQHQYRFEQLGGCIMEVRFVEATLINTFSCGTY